MNKNEQKEMTFAYILSGLILLASLIHPVSASDSFTIKIFGNANLDDRIDEMDISYVEGIISGLNNPTNLSDANYDGQIDQKDIDLIEMIMKNEESELVLMDYVDRVIKLKIPVERVALLNEYSAEGIQIFRVQDRIIGVDTDIREYTYLPEVSCLPDLGKAKNPDLETILSLNPDLILTCYYPNIPDLEKNIPQNIPIIDLSFTKPDNLSQEVKTLGYIFGKVDLADDYIENFHDKYVDLVRSRIEGVSENERPRVYLESSSPYKTYGNTTGAHQMMVLAGGKNIFDDMEGLPTVDPEAIIDKNPEIIIRGGYTDAGYSVDDSSKMIELRDEIMSRSGFDSIQAVNENKTHVVDVNLHYGLDYPIGLVYFAKIIHPELFIDVDPIKVHQEFLAEFLGVDLDLSEHGVFIYPPLEEN